MCRERAHFETPSVFYVTEGPLFSVFNSDICSQSGISKCSPGKERESSREKVKNREARWPAWNGSVKRPVKWSSSYYVMNWLCNMSRIYFVTQLQGCPTETHHIKFWGFKIAAEWLQTNIAVIFELDVRRKSALSHNNAKVRDRKQHNNDNADGFVSSEAALSG